MLNGTGLVLCSNFQNVIDTITRDCMRRCPCKEIFLLMSDF